MSGYHRDRPNERLRTERRWQTDTHRFHPSGMHRKPFISRPHYRDHSPTYHGRPMDHHRMQPRRFSPHRRPPEHHQRRGEGRPDRSHSRSRSPSPMRVPRSPRRSPPRRSPPLLNRSRSRSRSHSGADNHRPPIEKERPKKLSVSHERVKKVSASKSGGSSRPKVVKSGKNKFDANDADQHGNDAEDQSHANSAVKVRRPGSAGSSPPHSSSSDATKRRDSSILRHVADPDQIVVVRRDGEGGKPIFDRDELRHMIEKDGIVETLHNDLPSVHKRHKEMSPEGSSLRPLSERWRKYGPDANPPGGEQEGSGEGDEKSSSIERKMKQLKKLEDKLRRKETELVYREQRLDRPVESSRPDYNDDGHLALLNFVQRGFELPRRHDEGANDRRFVVAPRTRFEGGDSVGRRREGEFSHDIRRRLGSRIDELDGDDGNNYVPKKPFFTNYDSNRDGYSSYSRGRFRGRFFSRGGIRPFNRGRGYVGRDRESSPRPWHHEKYDGADNRDSSRHARPRSGSD